MHEGRDFQDVDDVKAPAVAIVSSSLARHVRSLDGPRQTQVSYEFAGTTRTVTVVGVVDDVLNKSLQAPAMPTLLHSVLPNALRQHDRRREGQRFGECRLGALDDSCD